MTKILCVAEKPSISKAVAEHLSGGDYRTVSSTPLLLSATLTNAILELYRFPVHQELRLYL